MSTTETRARSPRLAAVLREDERVTPLELFFDLVFVLAITQCTALMANDPTWTGLARGVNEGGPRRIPRPALVGHVGVA